MIVNCGNSPSGDKVKKIYIKKGVLEATILTYGATLQKLKIRNFADNINSRPLLDYIDINYSKKLIFMGRI